MKKRKIFANKKISLIIFLPRLVYGEKKDLTYLGKWCDIRTTGLKKKVMEKKEERVMYQICFFKKNVRKSTLVKPNSR